MIHISKKNLHIIQDLARTAFHDRPTFQDMSSAEMQAICLAEGLERYILKQGGIPGFTVEGFIQEDCEPVGDD